MDVIQISQPQIAQPECCPAPALPDVAETATMASQFAALGDVTRLQLALFIFRCAPAPVCACAFPESFEMSRSTISHHLTKLVNAGVLTRTQEGKWAFYYIAPDFDTRILAIAGEHISEKAATAMTTTDQPANEINATEINATEPTTILFACTRNAGRSQMAASIAQSLAPAHVTIRSAGTEPADEVHPEVITALEEIGLKPLSSPEKLVPEKVKEADWVITMGCGETCPIFPGKRYEDWEVADPGEQPIEEVRKIREDITARVKDLLARVENHSTH